MTVTELERINKRSLMIISERFEIELDKVRKEFLTPLIARLERIMEKHIDRQD